MPSPPSSGRPGARAPPPPPPPLRNPVPPNDPDPDPDLFDPNRTPPPPADAIFREHTPEEKVFQIPPLRPAATRRQRPLTGRPLASTTSRGIKFPREAVSEWSSGPARRAHSLPEANQNHLEVIQKSLHQIQSYLDTLAALASQKNSQPSSTPPPKNPQNPSHPRAIPDPSSSPATLPDLISTPRRSRKRRVSRRAHKFANTNLSHIYRRCYPLGYCRTNDPQLALYASIIFSLFRHKLVEKTPFFSRNY